MKIRSAKYKCMAAGIIITSLVFRNQRLISPFTKASTDEQRRLI